MADLALSLTYTPLVSSIRTDDVSLLMQRLDGAYQAGAIAPGVGPDAAREVWDRATLRQASESAAAETRRLITEIEYLDRAAHRGEGAASQRAYELAKDGLIRDLELLSRSGSMPRGLPPMECLQLRMESPLAVVLGIPDAFIAIGGVSGIGAFLAVLEKQANVIGRIKLERETLKLTQAKVVFQREQLEEERRAWRDALERAVANDEVERPAYPMIQLDTAFTLDSGVLDQLPPSGRPDELG